MQKILCIFGTRPEAIKMAPVIRELSSDCADLKVIVCCAGQHREMLRQVTELFGIRADYELDVMTPNQTLASLTAALLIQLDQVVSQCAPDWILAQGDTTTAMVAGLIAFYRKVRFGHVEAGLRTGDRWNPFPEEINRRVADLVADAYFAPTQRARSALLAEGVPSSAVHLVGNTVIDALLATACQPYAWDQGPLALLPPEKRIVLITAHRRESFGTPFRNLCDAIKSLSERFADDGVHFAYPVHLNPNVQKPVREILGNCHNVTLLPPLDYNAFVHLMKRATLALTDSGGVQEEAPSFSVPVLIMRETTERPEGVETGVARLVGTTRDAIVRETTKLLTCPESLAQMQKATNPYGDGLAAKRIAALIRGKPLPEFAPA